MIIAELCQNHLGKRDILELMVKTAADCGVWACKIQSFFAEDLGRKWRDHFDYYKERELSWDDHAFFVDLCQSLGVTPITSVYSFKYAEKLKELGFEYVKIGSPDCTSTIVPQYSLAGFNVIVSTGGHDLQDVKPYRVFAALHCVSLYPHVHGQTNLSRIIEVKNHWGALAQYVGFSDHSDPMAQHHPNYAISANLASIAAIDLGAKIIERHFTVLSPKLIKDGPVSIGRDALQFLCEYDQANQTQRDMIKRSHGFESMLACGEIKEEADKIAHYQDRWIK